MISNTEEILDAHPSWQLDEFPVYCIAEHFHNLGENWLCPPHHTISHRLAHLSIDASIKLTKLPCLGRGNMASCPGF